MDVPVTRQLVEAFYDAFTTCDPGRIAATLTHDVEWQMDGPVSVFPFCGHRRGKAPVLDLLTRHKAEILPVRRVDQEDIVIDGQRAAVFAKITAIHKQTGRVVVFHCVHFLTFRDGLVSAVYCIADTFDAAEQVIGHRIDAYHEPQGGMPFSDRQQDIVVI